MDELTHTKVSVLAKYVVLAKSAHWHTAILAIGLISLSHTAAGETERQPSSSTMRSSIVIADSNPAAGTKQNLPSRTSGQVSWLKPATEGQAVFVSDSVPPTVAPKREAPKSKISMVGKKFARQGTSTGTSTSSPWNVWAGDQPPRQATEKSSPHSRSPSQLTAMTGSRNSRLPLKPVQHVEQPNTRHQVVSRAIALEPVNTPLKSSATASRPSASRHNAHARTTARRPKSTTHRSKPRPSSSPSRRSTIALRSKGQPRLKREDAALLQAHKISETAGTEADYTKMLRLCAGALRQGAGGEKGDFARQLSAWALNRRGQLRADENQPELAMADFNRALEYDPDHWRALHNRGVTHAQSGQFAEAFDDFNRVLEINPTFAKAYSNRATLYVQAGNMQAALDQYTKSIQLDSSLATAQIGRGRVCHRLGRLDEALEHLNAAVTIDPSDAQIICSRADLLADMGKYRQAMADYARAIDLNPEFAHAYRNGAWLLATCPDVELRDVRNALIGAQRALEFGYGQKHVALDTLAAAQANAGQYDEAIVSLQQAIDIAPPAARQTYEVRLQLYEQHQPFRTTPLADVYQAGYEQ